MRKLIAALLLCSSADAQLLVSAVSPAEEALSASTATDLVVVFSAAVDGATVDADSFQVFGRWSGPREGSLSVAGSMVTWRPARAFFPGERVSVMLASTIASTTGDPLALGHTWSFWTRAGKGSDSFTLVDVQSTRLPGEGLITSYGIYAGDLDRDGAPDFSIPNEGPSDVRVFRNDGCASYPTLEVYPVPAGSTPSANEGGDFNRDGYPDLAVANISGDSTSVLLNDGAGTYLPAATYTSGGSPRGVAVLDVEADGDADLAIPLRDGSRVALHKNAGNGTFGAAQLLEAGVNGETSIAAVDANLDGISDLYVGGYDSQNVAVMTGSGTGTFTTTDTSAVGGAPWMLAAGDVDGDGDVDVASCNSTNPSASILRNNGAGALGTAQNYATGSFPIAVDLGDADGDGDLDLVVSNYSSASWTYRHNNGTGMFGPATTFPAQFAGSCMILVDDDRDGDVDLIGIDEISDEIFYYRQESPAVAGVELMACSAQLRVNSFAGNAGFGSLPAHSVSLAERAFLDISTAPGTAFGIFAGPALAPGIPTAFGLLNLSVGYGIASGVTDAFGEGHVALDLPPTLSPGATTGLQGFVLTLEVTNAESLVIVP
jgi:hypothetical protein